MFQKLLNLGLLVVLAGCGSEIFNSLSPTSTVMGGERYETQGNVNLTFTNDAIRGSGKVIASSPRPTDDSSYKLEFSIEEGGSVTLVSNAKSDLEGGILVRFYRRNSGLLGAKLQTSTKEYDFSDEIIADALGTKNVGIEVHGHGHLIVSGLSKEPRVFGTSALTSGRYWGMILENAKVTQAVAAGPSIDG